MGIQRGPSETKYVITFGKTDLVMTVEVENFAVK
jgi:hypothetical protein